MSTTLNLLSDGTFASKIDEQNAILEDIRDNVGGGGSDLKTAAVRSDAPDSQGVSQFYKLDAQGNRTNVYPALSPVGSLNWIVPKIPSEARNTDDIFISQDTYDAANPNVATSYYTIVGNAIKFQKFYGSNINLYLWIKNITFGITSNDDLFKLFTFIPQELIVNLRNYIGLSPANQSTNYLGYTVAHINNATETTIKLLYG